VEWDSGWFLNGAIKPKNKTVSENVTQIWVAIHSGRFEKLLKPGYERGSPLTMDRRSAKNNMAFIFQGVGTAWTTGWVGRIIAVSYLPGGGEAVKVLDKGNPMVGKGPAIRRLFECWPVNRGDGVLRPMILCRMISCFKVVPHHVTSKGRLP
jgi:hypothetical protein